MSGLVSYMAGAAAEAQVARGYAEAGATIVARRWRSKAGEIDLIVREQGTLVFVEVKRARDHATAAARVSPRQLGRIDRAARDYLGREAGGQDTDCRIDIALVDDRGMVEVLRNATLS